MRYATYSMAIAKRQISEISILTDSIQGFFIRGYQRCHISSAVATIIRSAESPWKSLSYPALTVFIADLL